MRINHNIAALNTHRQLGANNTQASKNLEKLSSGLKINRAGDDAAGLAISEKMRGQIRGLDMASKNAQDGISLIQTAEGALNETHAILQRMRELAVQSSNDTNTDTDRAELQKEVDQLAEEVSRISKNTEFNTQNLLDGSFKGTFHIGANANQNISLSLNEMSAATLGVEGNVGLVKEIDATVAVDITDTHLAGASAGDKFTVEKLGKTQTVSGLADTQYVLRDSDKNIVGISKDGADWKLVGDDAALTNNVADVALGANTTAWNVSTSHTKITSGTIEVTAKDAAAGGGSNEIHLDIKANATLVDKPTLASGDYKITDSHVSLPASSKGLLDAKGNLVAYAADADNKWKTLDGTDLFTKALGSAGDTVTIGGAGIDISSQSSADKAITTIQSAIDTVSAERSKLGAMQNRLEHTINNLGTSSENLTAAESRIRDVDYVLAAA